MLSRESMMRKLHVRDEYYRRRARGNFAEFLRYTKPDYQLSWFHEELAGELDQFLDDVLQKRGPRWTEEELTIRLFTIPIWPLTYLLAPPIGLRIPVATLWGSGTVRSYAGACALCRPSRARLSLALQAC